MALLRPLLTTMVLCSCGPVESLSCHLPQNSLLLSRKTFEVLEQMRRVSPVLCLKDRRDFQFPREMVDVSQLQRARAASVLQMLLQQMFRLFHTERASVAWSPALLQDLRSELQQQLQNLSTCSIQASLLDTEGPALALRRYFRRIALYLEEKQYSNCAWEIVRQEITRAYS
ncbi:interferon omega-1-like [Perognathus longimembris pacificus]|uniref:interferon omega-1-like n=1 Tax=Perognathus longimembris pacificus TaxID=214514 RepID=UPI0020185A69|nr:interferon omega-1-like [Perognathus longimembris pacificus]